MTRAALLAVVTLALAVSWSLPGVANAQQTPDTRVADLVQAGKVRVGIGVVGPHWATKDPATGELRGVAVDLARAFAMRLGVELVPVEYPSPPLILEGLKGGAWDVAFLGVDPSRADLVDFSPPYLQIDATYLVPPGSTIRSVADADRPGLRIAVARKSVEEIALTRALKRATLRSVETARAGFDLLQSGNADALAAPRPTLLESSSRLPGSRVLDDRFNATFAAMVVPKGQAARLAYVRDFIEQAKSSGLVEQAIEHAGARGVQPVR